jgi:anaerobic magnesium-protoporphyrin IX monomethyl ester cyclase
MRESGRGHQARELLPLGTVMKKLILTYPNQRWHKFDMATTWSIAPTTLCLLGGIAKDVVEVKIVDANRYDMSREQFRGEIDSYRPDYVGISVLTSEYGDTLDVAADLVKSVDPGIVTICGGVHVTTLPYEVMRNPKVDYGCRGEGDYLLRDLMLYLEGRGPFPRKGLIYRENGEIKVQERAQVEDMKSLPWPDYDLVRLEDYVNSQERYGPNRLPELPGITVVMTRGCPYGCTFCQVERIAGKKIRAADPVSVVAHLAFLKERYGIRSIQILDDNLFAHKEVAKTLMREMIAKQLGIKWICSSFALFALDDEMLDLMHDAGCIGVNCAIESGNERVLREIIRKPIKDLVAVPRKIAKIRARGIFVIANFIIGSPGETWEEIRETIRFAENCGADYVKLFVAVMLPGTPMHDMAVDLGALAVPKGELKVQWRHSQLSSPEWTARDISILRAYEWDRINFSPERIERVAEIWGMPLDEINRIRKQTRDSLQL